MNKLEAEEIINKYGAALATDKGPFRKISTLPCSKAKINYAFYVYIPAIIEELGNLPEEIGSSLAHTYSVLHSFIDDSKIDGLNSIGLKIENKSLNNDNELDRLQVEEYFLAVKKGLLNMQRIEDINLYIKECRSLKKF